MVANPIAVTDELPHASLRQRNAYFSSSDAAFQDRYQASDEWARVKADSIAVDGGWRIYSSGPGLYAEHADSPCLRAQTPIRQANRDAGPQKVAQRPQPSHGPAGPAAARGRGDESGRPRVSARAARSNGGLHEGPEQESVEGDRQSGDPRRAIDDRYATTWKSKPAKKSWLKIDLGEAATLAGLEVYWGQDAPVAYAFKSSLDGKRWTHLCRTRHGEGGQDVFAFPPVEARFVRWACDDPQAERGKEIVEINLYGPADAASVWKRDGLRRSALRPSSLPKGESITVDFGYVRSPLGAFIEWGAAYGTDFSVYLSDDGKSFREVGRILDRQWRQRQLLVALDHEPLFSLDRPRDERAGGRDRQRAQAAHPQQGSHADRSARARGGGRARRPLSAVAARPPSLLDRARQV